MRKWLWHSRQSPQSLSFYWWFSVAGWIVSVTSTHKSSSVCLFWPSYTVTHYIATITVFKLCMQVISVLKSFHLPTRLLHQHLTHQTQRAWPEMSCDQCSSLEGPWRCSNRETKQQFTVELRDSVNLYSPSFEPTPCYCLLLYCLFKQDTIALCLTRPLRRFMETPIKPNLHNNVLWLGCAAIGFRVAAHSCVIVKKCWKRCTYTLIVFNSFSFSLAQLIILNVKGTYS